MNDLEKLEKAFCNDAWLQAEIEKVAIITCRPQSFVKESLYQALEPDMLSLEELGKILQNEV